VIVVGGEALVDLVEDDGVLRPVPGGGPFNTAIALGRLGIPAAFLGTLSRDDYGRLLGRQLTEAGVDMSLVRWSDAPTPLAVVHGQDGDNAYTFYLAGTALTDLPREAVPALPEQAWAIHVGTLALAVDPPAAAYGALLDREARHRTILLDPNVRPAVFGDQVSYRARFERLVRFADVVKLSEHDAAWIYPELETADVVERVLDLGPALVALTMGALGAVAASREGRARVPGVPIVVVDTVGAGDSFGAALLAALVDRDALQPGARQSLGDSLLQEVLAYAVTASAITCTRRGAVPPSRADLEAWTGGAGSSSQGRLVDPRGPLLHE
jgi:fructokinase